MSDLGPMQYEQQSGSVFLGRDYGKSKNFSDQVALEIDRETRKIIEECYENAKEIISKNKELINLLSDALMKYETLTKEQIEYIVENKNIEFKEEFKEEKKLTIEELKNKAKELKIKGYTKMTKEELEEAIDGKEE